MAMLWHACPYEEATQKSQKEKPPAKQSCGQLDLGLVALLLLNPLVLWYSVTAAQEKSPGGIRLTTQKEQPHKASAWKALQLSHAESLCFVQTVGAPSWPLMGLQGEE